MAEEGRTSTKERTTSSRAPHGAQDREASSRSETSRDRIPGANLFDQALENYEQALKAGLRLQEESTKWWGSMLNEATSPGNWHRAARSFSDEAIPEAQRRIMEDMVQLVEQNSRQSLELLRKANEASWSMSASEAQRKLQNLWESSLELLRSNAAAMTQLNTRTLDAWMDVMRRNADAAMNGASAIR